MQKISDLSHYVLFQFITDSGTESSTTDVETILSITNENIEGVDGFYIGNKIILADGFTYKILDISIFNLYDRVMDFSTGMLPAGMTGEVKSYLLGVKIHLSKLQD